MVEIGGLPSGKTLYRNLQRIKYFIGREYGTPAAILKRGGQRYLAVATKTKKQSLPPELEVPVLQGLAARLRLLPDHPLTLDLTNLHGEDEFVATTFIGFTMRGYLRNHPNLWQGASSFLWYTKDPLELPKHKGKQPPVALYPGFSYRVLVIPKVGLCVAVDVVHVYTDTRTLAQRIADGEDWRSLVGRHFVYEFGPNWYFIQLREASNHSISEARFEHPRSPGRMTDVYEYTLEKWRGRETTRLRQLCPEDQALVYNYPNQSGQFRGATSLARLRYQTEDPEIGRLHRLTILEPEQRLERIQNTVATYLDSKVTLGDIPIRVGHEPLSVPTKIFPVPSQQFGNGRVLDRPGRGAEALKEMWQTRVEWLCDKQIGPFNLSGIRNQFILIPLSLAANEALMDRIQEDLVAAVNQISSVSYHPTPVVWDDQGGRTIPQFKRALAEPKQLMERSGVACALVILPEGLPRKASGKLRRHIKRMLYPKVRTKCVQADKLLSYFGSNKGEHRVISSKYWSYLRNTALDILVTSGYWLWALAEPLHYDLYVGIDVLHNTAGFTFVAANGAICRFHASTSEQKEKLSAGQMARELLENLGELIPRVRQETGALPRHLIVHRDGRFYDTEQEGLYHAVTQLQRQEGLLPSEVHVGVVEIHKSHAERLRLFGRLRNRIVNPWVGSYHIFDEHWGMLCTTGYPGIHQGTANPLVAKIVDGDLDIAKVLRDVYWLSILAWTKPDGVQGDPVTIKLADDWLEPIAARVSENEGVFELLADEETNSAID